MTRYYEDLPVGTTYSSEHGRTISEADIFSWPTGGFIPVHTDREYVRSETRFEDVLPPNSMIMAYMTILHVNSLTDDVPSQAIYGKDDYRFPNPIYPGDTVSTESEIVDKFEIDADAGVLSWEITLLNQDDEVVAIGKNLVMTERRPADA